MSKTIDDLCTRVSADGRALGTLREAVELEDRMRSEFRLFRAATGRDRAAHATELAGLALAYSVAELCREVPR